MPYCFRCEAVFRYDMPPEEGIVNMCDSHQILRQRQELLDVLALYHIAAEIGHQRSQQC